MCFCCMKTKEWQVEKPNKIMYTTGYFFYLSFVFILQKYRDWKMKFLTKCVTLGKEVAVINILWRDDIE